MIESLVFYMFSAVLLFSGAMTVSARNPVHAVLFLILAFFNAAGLFLLLGAEFLAFILVIVYVGAVAVLFLFVVMMLDINFSKMRQGFRRYLPIGLTVGGVLLLQLIVVSMTWVMDPKALTWGGGASAANVENTRAIGQVLYTDYFYPFQVSGFILLVAMVGAIVLTHRPPKNTRRQSVKAQLDRQISDVIDIVKVESGKGVS
jgi:NADH-quinone oxidoreductase subunit J